MSDDYTPRRARGGGMLQSAVPKRTQAESEYYRTGGLLVRGVVMNTYVADDDLLPAIDTANSDLTAVYCDVYVYSGLPGNKVHFFPRCLVSQERSGMHEGDIWVPRATTLDITGVLDLNTGSNPADLDGDHVLLGFMDDNFGLPVVLRAIPHPNADIGKTQANDLGERLKLRQADGQPRKWKHRGAVWGVDKDGNWEIDLRNAHTGDYLPDGSEPPATQTGTSGAYTARIQPGAFFKIVGPNEELIEIDATGRVIIVTAAARGDQSIELNIDGQVLIDARKSQSSIDMAADGTITTTSGATLQKQTLDASEVQVGQGATESAMRGDQWKSLHTSYDSALTGLLGGITTLLPLIAAKLVPAPVPGDPISVALGNLAGLASAFATAQAALVAAGPPGALSSTVTVKD